MNTEETKLPQEAVKKIVGAAAADAGALLFATMTALGYDNHINATLDFDGVFYDLSFKKVPGLGVPQSSPQDRSAAEPEGARPDAIINNLNQNPCLK